MNDGLTLEEQEEILLVAEGLLREPNSWVQGLWKCPATKFDENKHLVPATDANGEPLYQYCIHGAVNQATYDVLGEERALALGAVRLAPEGLSFTGGDDGGVTMAERLDLDRISMELYDMEAMEYNDTGSEDEYEEPATHEGVLRILRSRLGEVRGLLKRKPS